MKQKWRSVMQRPRIWRWHVLEKLIKEHEWKLGAELGVLQGRNLTYLLDHCPALSMVGVDVWKPPRPGSSQYDLVAYKSYPLEEFYTSLVAKCETYGPRAELLRMTTAKAAKQFPNNHFDFIFIDADHSRRGVTADIKNWSPKVKPGGWILGHDYKPHPYPVSVVVDEIFGPVQHFADLVWGIPKKETRFA